MLKKSSSESALFRPRAVAATLLCASASWLGVLSFAATPSTGTLSETTPDISYTAGPFVQSNPVPVPLLQSNPTCNNTQNPCDSYTLTTSFTAEYITANPSASAKVVLSWPDTGSGNSDYDLYIYEGEVGNTTASTPATFRSASSGHPEIASIFPLKAGDNKYTIKIVPYIASGETVNVRIQLQAGDGGALGFPGFGSPDPTVAGNARYQTFYPPKGSGAESSDGEMNIGFNGATGRFMLNNIGPVWRVTPPEIAAAGAPECCDALWEDRSSTIADTGVDPILWTDAVSGRTFASNFTGGPNALYAYTDSDGEPTASSPTGWTVVGAAVPTGGADHQTIGSGPYPASLSSLTNAVNKGQAVYYCSQAVVGPAFCQRSDDQGQSYGPGTLAYSGSDCGGLHGHIRVGPDGTAYLPVPDCGGKAGVAVSTDGGVTWKEFFLPNSLPQSAGSDSAISIDAENNLYYFYIVSSPDATKGTMHVQVGKRIFDASGALTDIEWSKDTDLGASHGVLNSAFPHAVAGDNGRAAVGFLGTDRPGDFQSLGFPGYWYAFMSTTFDGGNTWVTTNVSPNDPVQGKGGIWQQGGSATNRNLLDFNEITIDTKGRPAFAYSDGCVGACVGNPDVNSFTAHMRLARQSGGRTLYASHDQFVDAPNAPVAPKAPCLSGARDENASHLKWVAPDNGGADTAYYKIFRGTSPGNVTFLADTGSTLDPNPKTTFDDKTADPAVEHYYYTVQAVNSEGASVSSNEIDLVVVELPPDPTPCALPGMPVLTDAANDSVNTLASTDIRQLSMAEIYDPAATANKLFIRLKMRNLETLPPETRWVVRFTRAEGGTTTEWFVSMLTEAPAGSTTAPVFRYGHVEVGAGGTSSNVTDGTLDNGSFSSDGTIILEISKPTKTGTGATNREFPALQTGEVFSNVSVVVFQKIGVSLQQMDTTSTSSYTLVGNAFCKPNAAPLPALTANPTSGTKPLTVNFNAGDSRDPDAGDGVASYHFEFGDGTSATQAGPLVSHTYNEVGEYRPKVRVTDSKGLISESAAEVTILVNDAVVPPPPDAGGLRFSQSTYDASENGGTATIKVVREGGSAGAVTVDYSTSNGSATAGADYTATSGTLSFAAGEVEKEFTVPVLDDTADEDDEAVNLALTNPSNRARLATPNVAVLRILDNDAPGGDPGTLRFSAANYSVGEDGGTATITVGRTGGTFGTVSVSYATSDGTATANSDYTPASGTLTFADGETTKSFSVVVTDEPSPEQDETVILTLSNPTGATLGSPSSATLTILDTDRSGPPAQLLNISTRLRVQSGPRVGIAGFIVSGNGPKRVLLRGIGPSLAINGQPMPERLQDPVIELYDSNGVFIASNDDWKDSPERTEIEGSGVAPTRDEEAAIARTINPGVYTVVLSGKGNSEGIALVEAYDRDQGGPSEMANISTRGFVDAGNNVLIGGFIAGGRSGATNVVVRAIGPSLTIKNVPNALQDPTVELVNEHGDMLDSSDDWKTSADRQAIAAYGLGPDDDRESAALYTLNGGNYTAIVRGKAGASGIALVEIYNVQ